MTTLIEEHSAGVLDALQARLGEKFEVWYRGLKFIPAGDNTVDIPVPNLYYKEWVERELKVPIEEAFQTVAGFVPEIRFLVVSSQETLPAIRPTAAPASPTTNPPFFLKEELTFASYVVGPSNRLAHAAAAAVSEAPGSAYNPLFIHGGVGLGKTHLLQAICHAGLKENPALRILYVSCEGFVNDYISALQRGKMEAFRARYRNTDILVIDDVHFLANKENSQEEFFHTFNALHGARRQIVLSSDSPPQDIPRLKEQLVSRFRWGFEAHIDSPTYEMRVAIARRKAEAMMARAQQRFSISDETYAAIAQLIPANIRELEGYVTRVLGVAFLSHRTVNAELVREVLGNPQDGAKPVSIADIQRLVAGYYQLRITDLQSKHWTKTTSQARQLAIYLSKKHTSHSLKEIGSFFGGKDHTTILYAIARIEKKLSLDPHLQAAHDHIQSTLTHAP